MGWFIEFYHVIVGNKYWHALAIFIIALLFAELLVLFFKKVVDKIVKKTKSKADNRIVMRIETPIIALIILVGFQFALRKIITSVDIFENIVNTIIILIITYIFTKIINILLEFWRKSRLEDIQAHDQFHEEMLPLMKSLTAILLTLVAIMVVLQMWGVQVGALLASVGVIGVILGFAFQDTMKNIFGGIALISDGSIHKHDVIRLETGEAGEVVEMTLRSTKIKTFDNDYLLIPNGMLTNSRFINYAQPTHTIRVVLPISVAYGSDVTQVKEVLLSVLKGRTDILKYPKREARFMKMGEYALEFDFLFYISDYKNKFTMIDQITTESYNALQAAGIEIPFPTRTIYEAKHKDPKPILHTSTQSLDVAKEKKFIRKSRKKTVPKTTKKKN
ncbi:mechanosensitive ion channel family protein [Candidatus Woesearchaeota archaeon]|nr:mechanosensitive ion channel family protein [Candidatus Woesearchaeota archaeon]